MQAAKSLNVQQHLCGNCQCFWMMWCEKQNDFFWNIVCLFVSDVSPKYILSSLMSMLNVLKARGSLFVVPTLSLKQTSLILQFCCLFMYYHFRFYHSVSWIDLSVLFCIIHKSSHPRCKLVNVLFLSNASQIFLAPSAPILLSEQIA